MPGVFNTWAYLATGGYYVKAVVVWKKSYKYFVHLSFVA